MLRPINAPPPPPPPVDDESPTAPTNVAAVAVSATRVNLTWTASTDNVGVARYDIYRNGGSTRIGTSTGASFADTGASPETAYTYTVVAVDAIGNASVPSAASNEVTTPATPPPPPPVPVEFRSASYAANKGVTTLKLPRPTGLVAGDFLLASIDVIGTPTVTAPAGWTLVVDDVNGTLMTKLTYRRVAATTEPGNYVWTFSDRRARVRRDPCLPGCRRGRPHRPGRWHRQRKLDEHRDSARPDRRGPGDAGRVLRHRKECIDHDAWRHDGARQRQPDRRARTSPRPVGTSDTTPAQAIATARSHRLPP